MEHIKEFLHNVVHNDIVIAVFCIIVVIILLILLFKSEKFLGEFTGAPVATQRSSEILGVGNNLRFSSEFSSTSQGGGNVIADTHHAKEHMVGGMEAPVFQSSVVPVGIDISNYRDESISNPGDEPFTGRTQFTEGYSNDEQLKKYLKGL